MNDTEILTQDDAFEEDLEKIEEETAKEKVEEIETETEQETESAVSPTEAPMETYEAIEQKALLGVQNTVTGEVYSGFEEKDKPVLFLLKKILNDLNQLKIAAGV